MGKGKRGLMNKKEQWLQEELIAKYQKEISSKEGEKLKYNFICYEEGMLKEIKEGKYGLSSSTYFSNQLESMMMDSKDAFQMSQYIAISLLAIFTRTAIEKKVPIENAFAMRMACIQMLEKLSTVQDIQNLLECAKERFVYLIEFDKREKKTRTIVERCKKYVQLHIYEKISVEEIANTIHANKDYISYVFHKQEGIPLVTYIQQQKIQVSKTMLVSKRQDLESIRRELGFNSQSYFSTVFKKHTGMTPAQYRKEYGEKEKQYSI